MQSIKLLDVDTKIMYTLEVPEEDAKRASQDVSYATQLLQNYLEKSHDNFSEDEITKSTKLTKLSRKSVPSTSSTYSTSSTSLYADNKKEKTTDTSSEKNNFMDGYRWSHEAILALFDVYKEEEHIVSSGASMKKFWNIVSAKLNEKGYYVNDSQCKSKMAGLRNTHKNMKDYNGKHTYSCRKWRYMEIMDEMYKKNPWASAVSIIKTKDDSIRSNRSIRPIKSKYVDEDGEGDEDNEGNNVEKVSSPPPKPESSSRRVRQLERIISVVEENTIERKRMHKEAMTRQDKLLDILEKMYNSIKDRDEAHSSESSPNKIQLPTKRLHKFSTTEKLITAIEESNSKRSRMHEDVMTRQDKLLSILEKMFEK